MKTKGHYCYGCETYFHDDNPNVTEHKGCKGNKSLGICVDGKEFVKYPFVCHFLNRTPNPGLCHIIEINYETQKLEVSNGVVRLFPNFDEVEIFKVKGYSQSRQPLLKKVEWGELVIIHRIDDTWIMTRKEGNFYHILSKEFDSYNSLREQGEYRYKDEFQKGIRIMDIKALNRRKRIETIKSKI